MRHCYTCVLHEGCQDGGMTYVQRRANRYEFRFRIPDDLAGKNVPAGLPDALADLTNKSTGRLKREIVQSLRTNDFAVAKRKVLSHIAEAQALVDATRPFFL